MWGERIISGLGATILAFGFVNVLTGFIPVGFLTNFLMRLFETVFVDSLMFLFVDVLQFRLSQSEISDILLAFALAGVTFAGIRLGKKRMPKRGLKRVPLAAYAVLVCFGTLLIHFFANEVEQNYAKACLQETTTDWGIGQVVDLLVRSNYAIEHCVIHQRGLRAAPPATFLQPIEFFVQYLGSTLILFVIPLAIVIAFLMRRLDINKILLRNAGAAGGALLIVFGLGPVGLSSATEESTTILADVSAGTMFQDCDTCPELIVVPSGSFQMGAPPGDDLQPEERQVDEKGRRRDNAWPVREVAISAFAAGLTEVTWAEWQACADAGGCRNAQSQFGVASDEDLKIYSPGSLLITRRPNRPVLGVTWEDTQAYVSWLSETTGDTYRLLSEAEWEYVARGGTQSRFWYGDDPVEICNFGNIADRTFLEASCEDPARICAEGTLDVCSDQEIYTAATNRYPENGFGLYGLLGNADEWVMDCYRNRYFGAPVTGRAITTGDCARRVVRGGSYTLAPVFARSAARRWGYPDTTTASRGFRVARNLK